MTRKAKIQKLLRKVDEHPADATVEEGLFIEACLRKFDKEEDLCDKEIRRLLKILTALGRRPPGDEI